MDNSTTPTVPPAAADPAPAPGEQLAADETAVVRDLAGTHARLETAEMRFCFHSGYLAALHTMRTAAADGIPTPDVRTGILTDAEREKVTRTVESLLQRRRGAQTPDPMGDESTPGWLTFCPHWCTDTHEPGEHPDDRQHTSTYYCTPLQTMDYIDFGRPGAPDWQPRELMAALVQKYREVEPRVLILDNSDEFALYLTLGEARQLRTHLDELLADADGDLPSAAAGTSQAAQTARGVLAGIHADNVRRGEVKPPPPQCEVWCTDHRTEVSDPEDSYCRRPAEGVEGMFLTATGDGLVLLSSIVRDEFTLEQFEEYARAGLELVAAGRSGGAL